MIAGAARRACCLCGDPGGGCEACCSFDNHQILCCRSQVSEYGEPRDKIASFYFRSVSRRRNGDVLAAECIQNAESERFRRDLDDGECRIYIPIDIAVRDDATGYRCTGTGTAIVRVTPIRTGGQFIWWWPDFQADGPCHPDQGLPGGVSTGWQICRPRFGHSDQCAGIDFEGVIPTDTINCDVFDFDPLVTLRFQYVRITDPCSGGVNNCEFCP